MILVVAEHREGSLSTSTREAIVFAQRAGRDLGVGVQVVVIGSGVDLGSINTLKMERIVAVEASGYDPDVYVHIVKSIAEQLNPVLFMFTL
jgi:hypothetical protein